MVALSFGAKAQWSFEPSVDLQSRYVWRGQALGGDGPSVQPGATIGWNGLTLGVWGTYNLGMNSYQELDWTLAYSMLDETVTLMVTDYAFPTLASGYRYFDYAGSHVIEAGVVIAIPKTNLSLAAYTNFFGADARTVDDKMVYSTYAELQWTLPWEKQKTEFDMAIGAALNGKAGYSFYGNDGVGVVNIAVGATKELHVSPTLSIPCYGRIVANPVANQMFLLCGTHIDF